MYNMCFVCLAYTGFSPLVDGAPHCGTNKRWSQTKTSMFPAAHTHCILTTKFARSFFSFFNDVCLKKKIIKVEKGNTYQKKISNKMIFGPELAKDIKLSLCDKSNIWVCFCLAKQISKSIGPYLWHCFCVLFFLLIKRLLIAVFLLMKWKLRKLCHTQQFFSKVTGNTLVFSASTFRHCSKLHFWHVRHQLRSSALTLARFCYLCAM